MIVFVPSGDHGVIALDKFCAHLNTSKASPLLLHGPSEDPDAYIDTRVVFQTSHAKIDLGAIPELLLPRKGRYGLIDYQKVFCPDLKNGPDIFDIREVDRSKGAVVIVRPDQYVAGVLPLGATEKLLQFFKSIA